MVVRDQSLFLEATGDDPYLSAPVSARGGRMVLRFWDGQMDQALDKSFWWTDQLPQPDGGRQLVFQLDPGSDREYAIEFPVEGELKGVRIDPLQGQANSALNWISLEYAAGENGTWSGTDVDIQTIPSTEVNFAVTDADGSPCMAAFEIRDEQGRSIPINRNAKPLTSFSNADLSRNGREHSIASR